MYLCSHEDAACVHLLRTAGVTELFQIALTRSPRVPHLAHARANCFQLARTLLGLRVQCASSMDCEFLVTSSAIEILMYSVDLTQRD